MIHGHIAPSGRRPLILAAMLASWCALTLGANTAQSAPLYPKGVWSPFGPYQIIPPDLVNNMGIVGLNVSEDWSDINTAPGVYDWSALDDEVAQAQAAGFKINLLINNGSDKTPQWLLDSLPAGQKIDLIDPAANHSTFCQPIATALYWNPVFHQARLDLIAAAGAHFTSNPAIQGFMASFANHHSNDWNIQDTVGIISCPACPQPSPTQCGDVVVDQVQQWLDAGWTEQAMLQVGKDICDAAAAAFPNQYIKLPVGVTNSILGATDPGHTNGTQTTLCRDIEDYVYGNASLGIPPRPYANRFFMQRNSVTADWGDGTQYDTFTPGFDSGRYIKYMIRAHGHPNPPWTIPGQAGLQMIDSATNGQNNGCRQDGGPDGPCGPTCDPVCVMRTSLNVSLTYGASFIEIFQDDASNPALYNMIRAATVALGGAPRDATPTPTPTASPSPTPTPTATPSADLRVTVTDKKDTVAAGARNTYTIVVKNLGPDNVTGAGVTDTFPAIFTGVTFTATQSGGASGFTASGTGNINDSVTMPNGSGITYKATGTISPTAHGSISDTATVTAPNGVFDPKLTNNSATDTDTIQ